MIARTDLKSAPRLGMFLSPRGQRRYHRDGSGWSGLRRSRQARVKDGTAPPPGITRTLGDSECEGDTTPGAEYRP
jgi:hypothetical protein